MDGEGKEKAMEMNFSRINLEYLVQARDLAREDPERVAVLLGMSRKLAYLLADATPQELTHIMEIKPPLLIPRQESWWWQRLFKAVREGRPDELKAIMEHASLVSVPEVKGK